MEIFLQTYSSDDQYTLQNFSNSSCPIQIINTIFRIILQLKQTTFYRLMKMRKLFFNKSQMKANYFKEKIL